MVGEQRDLYDGHDGLTGLPNGHDELTGFPKLFYFATGFKRKKAELERSGRSNLLLCLHLDETTSEDEVKAVAKYWKKTFIRVCRYEKRDYTFLALDEDTSNPNAKDAREQEILEALVLLHPDLVVDLRSVVVSGDSGSVDELAAELSAQK